MWGRCARHVCLVRSVGCVTLPAGMACARPLSCVWVGIRDLGLRPSESHQGVVRVDQWGPLRRFVELMSSLSRCVRDGLTLRGSCAGEASATRMYNGPSVSAGVYRHSCLLLSGTGEDVRDVADA